MSASIWDPNGTVAASTAGDVNYSSDTEYPASTIGAQIPTRSIKEHGANRTNTTAQNFTALQAAIAAAQVLQEPAVIVIPPDTPYGYLVADETTWPQRQCTGVTIPILFLDYSLGADYGTYPTTYNGTQFRWISYTPQTIGNITWTANLLAGVTSAT